jgi:iron complex outermembrane recepter protein
VRKRAGILVVAATAALTSIVFAHQPTAPRAVFQPHAVWPSERALEHDLVVPVVLVVDASGAVESASVEFGVGEPFDSAAVRTALTWRFEPARDENGSLRAKVRAVVRFVGVPRVATLPAPTSAVTPAPPSGAFEPTPPMQVVVEGEAPARSASEVRRDRRLLGLTPNEGGSDMLLTVPGVFVTQHGGQGKAHQIFFRGFDAVHGQDIEFWVAGAPVNEVSNVHGQGYADLHFVMPEVVREIRAQPAAYDPRQGDFAVAGSMTFDLGYAEPGVTAKLGVGSFGTRRAFLAYHPAGFSERTFGAFELQETDGFGEARASQRASGIAQVDVPLAAGLELRLMTSLYAARFGSAGVLRLDDLEAGTVGRFESYDPDQGGRSSRIQVVATLQGGSDTVRLGFAPFFVRRSLVLRSNYTGYLENPVAGDSNQQTNEADTLGARAFVRRSIPILSPHDALEAGLLLRTDFIEQAQRRLSAVDDSVTQTEVNARVRAFDVGAYLDAELRPFPRLAVRGGVRADGVSFESSDQLGAGAARSAQGRHIGLKGMVDLALSRELRASASYGQGFRSPQARSLGDGERTPFARVHSQELGIRYFDAQGLSAAVAAYRTTLSEDLVFDEATARNRSVPGTLRLGIVADLVAEPVEWFTSTLGFTYTRATFRESQGRYEAGALVPFVPQGVLRMNLAVDHALRRLFGRDLVLHAGAGGTALFRRPIPYGEIGTDVFLVDAVAGARLQEVELVLEAFNLFDREWNDGEFVYASNFERGRLPSELPVRHVTVGAPRHLMLSLSFFI